MAQSDWTRLGGISRDTCVATGANVEAYVASQIGAAYKAKGSIAFANLPTPGSGYQGFVYNVTDAFTTTSSFVEGAGKSYPAGTNVVCVNTTGSTYAWDVLTGMVDISGKQDKITASGILKGDGAGGVTAAAAGTDYVKSVSTGTSGTVEVSGSGELKVDLPDLGNFVGSKGDSSNQTPGFGGTFKALSATVDKFGRITALDEHTVTIPSATAVATGQTGAKNGLMSADQAAALATAGTTASNNATARKTTLKTAIDTMYSRTTYPDKQSLYAALADMDDLADTLADLIIALRGFCDAS